MTTNRILVFQVLNDVEAAALDDFTDMHHGVESLSELRTFLAEHLQVELVLDPAIIEGFAEDSSHLPAAAQALCRPHNERECAVIMRACYGAGIPMTLSGGRSNLTGSATPEGGVLISTVHMTEPAVVLDRARERAVVPVGAILEDVRKEIVEQSGRRLHFPVDPTSRADASVGGALACNASGFTPGESGATRAWVHRLRLVLPDGRLVETVRGQYVSQGGVFVLVDNETETPWPVPHYERPAVKNAGGPYSSPDGCLDLVDLVIGSEGLFGLVTLCELTLAPRPGDFVDLFFSLPSEADALKVLARVRDHCSGDLSGLSAFEYFGANCRGIMDHETRFFHGDDTVAVYLQQPLHGRELEDAAEEWLNILVESGCDIDEDAILLLDSERLRTLFLEARHSLPANALEVVKQRGTYTIMTDTVVPSDRFAEFLEFAHALLHKNGLDYVAFGHLADCHLHFTVLPEKAQLDTGVDVYDAIVAKSAEMGGVYSGEHGTGKRKRRDFLRCYGPGAADEVRACKAAVDPEFLLNRGNVIEIG
ncbi:MAG: FAD-binding oxidoreductase [Lentisphaerae bacterium]|nr:FAD-binding oxidoreductase [Lentisphaerota bacterium]